MSCKSKEDVEGTLHQLIREMRCVCVCCVCVCVLCVCVWCVCVCVCVCVSACVSQWSDAMPAGAQCVHVSPAKRHANSHDRSRGHLVVNVSDDILQILCVCGTVCSRSLGGEGRREQNNARQ